jgi:predicted metal-dependent peptidase
MNKVDLLSKASKDIMLKEPYYGYFLIQLNKHWRNDIPTAGVSKNGINYQLAINETFWCGLTDLNRLGLLKHELLHIAFGHLTAYHNFADKRMANIAMDMEINQYIENDWLPGGEYTTEEFTLLKDAVMTEYKKAKDNNATPEELKEIESKIPCRGIMIDDYHELNLDTKAGTKYYYKKLKEAQEQKEQTGTSGSEAMDQLLDQMEQGMSPGDDHGTWEEFDGISETEQKLMEGQIQRILTEAKDQTEKKRGHVPGEMSSLIKVEEFVKPKFDWRGYVRRFTGTSTKVFTKKLQRKENRRFPAFPGLKIKMRQHILLAIDTSGSVSDSELKEFMNEIHHIYKTGVDITIIQCDTKINSIEPYKGKNDLNVVGRGGTEFDPVLEYYDANIRKFTSLIYFTDGECYTSIKPKGKILWVLSERSDMNDKLPGKIIKLEL